jgi:hypothetical protein
MRTILPAAMLSLVVVAAPQSQAPEQPRPVAFLERAFAPNGRVTMDLAAGEYSIMGSPDNRIRLDWSVRDGKRLSDVRARADVRGLEATVTTDGPDNEGLKGTIQVPARTDLEVYLTAGELTVENVHGNKDVRSQAGEIRIDVGRAEDYRRVRASVWAGEVDAEPFNVSKGGLFRSFDWTGYGTYQLRARLKAGEIRLYQSGLRDELGK